MNAKYQILHEYSNYTKSKTKQLNKYLLFQLVMDLLKEMHQSIRCYRIVNRKISSRFCISYRHSYISRLFITRFFSNMLNHLYLFSRHLRRIPRKFKKLSKAGKSNKYKYYLYRYAKKKEYKKSQFITTQSIVKNKVYILFIKFLFLLFRRRNIFHNIMRSGKSVLYHIRKISNYLFFQRHQDILFNVEEKVLGYDLRKRILDAIFNVGRHARKYRFFSKKYILNHITFNILLITNRFDLFKRQRRNRTFYFYKLKFKQLYKSMYNIRTTKLFNKYINYINTRLNRYVGIQNIYLYQIYIFLYSYFYSFLNYTDNKSLLQAIHIKINGIRKYLNNFHYFVVGDYIEIRAISHVFILLIRKLGIAFALSQIFYLAVSGLTDMFRMQVQTSSKRKLIPNFIKGAGSKVIPEPDAIYASNVTTYCSLYNHLVSILQVKKKEKLMASCADKTILFAARKVQLINKGMKKKKKLTFQRLFAWLGPHARTSLRIKRTMRHRKRYIVTTDDIHNVFNKRIYNRSTIFLSLLRIFKSYELKGSFKSNTNVPYSLVYKTINKLSVQHLKFIYNLDKSFKKCFLSVHLCLSIFKQWLHYITTGYFFNMCYKLNNISMNRYIIPNRLVLYNMNAIEETNKISSILHGNNLAVITMMRSSRPALSNKIGLFWSFTRNKPTLLVLYVLLCYCIICLIKFMTKGRQRSYKSLVLGTSYFANAPRLIQLQNLFFRSATYKMANIALLHSVLLLLYYKRHTVIWKYNNFAKLSRPFKPFKRRRFRRFYRPRYHRPDNKYSPFRRFNTFTYSRPPYYKSKFLLNYKKHKGFESAVRRFYKRPRYNKYYYKKNRYRKPIKVGRFLHRFFEYKVRKYKQFIAYRRNWKLLSRYFNLKSKRYLRDYAVDAKELPHSQKIYLKLIRRRPRFYNASRKYTMVKKIYYKFIGPILHSTRKFSMNNSFIKATYATIYHLWLRRFLANKMLKSYKRKYTIVKLINLLLLPIRKRYLKKSSRKLVRFNVLMLGVQRKFFRVPYKKVFKKTFNSRLLVYIKIFNNIYMYLRYLQYCLDRNLMVSAYKYLSGATNGFFEIQTDLSSGQILNMLNIRSSYYKNMQDFMIVKPFFYRCTKNTLKFVIYDVGDIFIIPGVRHNVPSSIGYLFNTKSSYVLQSKFR